MADTPDVPWSTGHAARGYSSVNSPNQWGLVFKYLHYRSSFSPWSNCMSHAGRWWQHRSAFCLTSTAPCDSSDRAPFDFHRTPINATGSAVGAAPGSHHGTAPPMDVRGSPADWTRSRGSPNHWATSVTSAKLHWALVWSGLISNLGLKQILSRQLCCSEEPAALGPGTTRLCEEHQQLKESQIKLNNLNHTEFMLHFLLRSGRLMAPTLHTFQDLLGIATGDKHDTIGPRFVEFEKIFTSLWTLTVLKSRVVWQSCDINWIFVFSSYNFDKSCSLLWDLQLVS